ncbi:MAG TPA: ATP-binding protein [Polyangia bacterium]|jgi:nitrogen fixation/metabolism regulation signal transduction histidine kinase
MKLPFKLPRPPGRFEWKILAALFIVASLPLGTAAYLLSATLNRVSTITDQHQKEVRASLGDAIEVYRAYFTQMKESFRDRANEIAAGTFSRTAELADVPDLLRARLLAGDKVVDEWAAPQSVLEHAREAPPNLVELSGSTKEAPRLLELTFGISKDVYSNFLALRSAMEREQELDRVFPLVLPMIFRGLGIAMVTILAFATALGLFVARRATGRVAVLREAARRVGEGDLRVRVFPRGRDELDELGRAFNRMVAELGEARSRLEYLQKVSAWQEVARRLAHEIKNPLTPIQLAVQELGSKYRGDDPAYARLLTTAQEILREEIDGIRRLVDDFSAFAKLPKVEPAPVDLGQVVEDFLRAHAEWQPCVRIERPPERVDALCDRMLIRRVLTNLVENAVQAAEGAGRPPEIILRVAGDPARRVAELVVDDNGPGIAAADRERIFDPYVTTKEHGTGLGLAIVRKVVIDHGGDVTALQAPPPLGGARLRVELPQSSTTRQRAVTDGSL